MLRPLIAGNWKMNGLQESLQETQTLRERLGAEVNCDVLVCPPATLIGAMAAQLENSPVYVGGQDCHTGESGAHTGDLSAQMLADAGASHVIVGHSERRTDHGEGDDLVRAKASAAIIAGVSPIVCVGESKEQREAGEALNVVETQILGSMPGTGTDAIVIAYEPVWAIGTGLTPSLDDIAQMHRHIRSHVGAATRILYGGSVKPGNAAEILQVADVDGALVGGASLKAEDFLGIIDAA